MTMKKLLVLTTIVVLLFTVKAYAFPVVYDAYNGLFFNNAEVLLDKDVSGTVSVGDTFWGTVQLQNIKAPSDLTGQTGPTFWNSSPTDEITGYFATDVLQVYNPGAVGGASLTDYTIVLGPATTDPNGILASDEVMRIYADNVQNYNDASQALALSTATDGTLQSSFGMLGGYWYTLAPVVPPGAGDVGQSYAGLNYVIKPWNTTKINDPNETYGSLDVDMFFNSELGSLGNFNGPNSGTLMHFWSDDPGVYLPSVIPEPTTMLLFGMGAAGLAAMKRKKRA